MQGHEIKARTVYASETFETWVICECGFKEKVFNLYGNRSDKLEIGQIVLSHKVDKLAEMVQLQKRGISV